MCVCVSGRVSVHFKGRILLLKKKKKSLKSTGCTRQRGGKVTRMWDDPLRLWFCLTHIREALSLAATRWQSVPASWAPDMPAPAESAWVKNQLPWEPLPGGAGAAPGRLGTAHPTKPGRPTLPAWMPPFSASHAESGRRPGTPLGLLRYKQDSIPCQNLCKIPIDLEHFPKAPIVIGRKDLQETETWRSTEASLRSEDG